MDFFISHRSQCGTEFLWGQSNKRIERRTNLLIMRISLIIIILTASIGYVTATTANAQSISISVKNVPLKDVLKEIEKQSGYELFYNNKHFENAHAVTLTITKKSLKQVLDECFRNQPLSYEIVRKTIVIKPKPLEAPQKEKGVSIAPITIKGVITDDAGKPLPGASVRVKGTSKATTTDGEGKFALAEVDEDAILIISYVGYHTTEIRADGTILVKLQLLSADLNEVSVISTGYQTIPKERATGAFTQIDTKTINRGVGINILDRLEGLASGLIVNRNLENAANNSKISVRGRSTIFANANPLIVLDGFSYDGTIDQINPADIENITILKDAAAASIWGTKASNGVIVITSKTGKKNQKMTIGVNSTITVGGKPDLNYLPQISSADYINLEQDLYRAGYYTRSISQKYTAISTAVEIMNRTTTGQISAADSAAQINALKGQDIRKDLDKYFYRQKVYQQYQVNISGGSQNNRFYMSAGYDKNLQNAVTSDYNRLSVNARNSIVLLDDRLEISGDLSLSASTTTGRANLYSPTSPYDRISDDSGNALPVVNNLRLAYVDTAGNGKLLDWHFRPKNEVNSNQQNRIAQYAAKFGISYKVLAGLTLSANYQYINEDGTIETNRSLQDYYTRNIINTYSSISGNIVKLGIPLGSILSQSASNLKSKTARFQIGYSKTVGSDHEINAIAGFEANDGRINTNSQTLYGYNPETKINQNNTIDPQKSYRYFYRSLSSMFSTSPLQNGLINFTRSYYGNFAYTFKKRYTLSGSARKDESNLFGVDANQKGVPLWSTGLAWNINQEDFYGLDWLPSLKLRATYGYNGNIDKTLSGYLTTQNYGFTNAWGSVYSTILNPPNPDLGWEKVKTWNFGIDYSLKNNRIEGSVDFYQKNAQDLIGNSPISMQSGVTQFKGNSADLQTRGIDVLLSSRNLIGNFQWGTTLLFNYNIDKITNYKIKQGSLYDIVSGNYNNPLEGFPYYGIFSFPSAGLDNLGNPQGYLNGQVTQDYSSILYSVDPSEIRYHGSASPKYFGSIVNTFSYRSFELSANLTYKLGYYFRRTSVFAGGSNFFRQSGYEKRWQKPGDESHTRIPSFVYPSVAFRDTFFQFSEDLIEKGDHLRLQDIRLSYQVAPNALKRLSIKNLGIFIYAQNLGILWRANKQNIDPDYGTSIIPQPIGCSMGINLSL